MTGTEAPVEVIIAGNKKKVNYYFHPQHRDATPKKSKWIISYDEELSCFKSSFGSGAENSEVSWGLIFNGSTLITLGHTPTNEESKLAKFISGSKNWHGYPADYRRNPQDRPVVQILLSWQKENIITKSNLVKLRRGKPCNL